MSLWALYSLRSGWPGSAATPQAACRKTLKKSMRILTEETTIREKRIVLPFRRKNQLAPNSKCKRYKRKPILFGLNVLYIYFDLNELAEDTRVHSGDNPKEKHWRGASAMINVCNGSTPCSNAPSLYIVRVITNDWRVDIWSSTPSTSFLFRIQEEKMHLLNIDCRPLVFMWSTRNVLISKLGTMIIELNNCQLIMWAHGEVKGDQ